MKRLKSNLLVVIQGPTAVGKTSVGIELAKEFNSEIVSADSRQCYKELNIGTAKPSDYELTSVPHHFINSNSIQTAFNVSEYEQQALKVLANIFKKHSIAFLVGGSGLYIHAITHGFDEDLPGANHELRKELTELFESQGINKLQSILKSEDKESYSEIDIQNPVRIIRAIEIHRQTGSSTKSIKNQTKVERPFEILNIGLKMERQMLYDRINERVDKMINDGLVEEARELIQYKDKNALKTVGYQELFRYFDEEITKEEAIEKIKVNSRRYAKRQIAWFKRYSDIQWFESTDLDQIKELINNHRKEE